MSKPIRLMIVDDHPIMRAGLANVLNMDPTLEIVAQADDGEAALKLWEEFQPDVGLFDLSLSGIDGIETLRRLRTSFPLARVIMLTSSEAREDIRHAMLAGAKGYVTKSAPSAELITAIRFVHSGKEHLSEVVSRRLAEDEHHGELSSREVEVLGLVRQGFTNTEIGRLLGITERTARFHLQSIMQKLNASDRAAAVARGFEIGLLKV
jgi:DNA-binding NarL/FixJ family response regulator